MKIIIDTNVWIGFFIGRSSCRPLAVLLEAKAPVLHPWVFGELLLGNMGHKLDRQVGLLSTVETINHSPNPEDLAAFIIGSRLSGSGIGWVDAAILSAAVTLGFKIWTWDNKLHAVAKRFNAEYTLAGDPHFNP